MRSIWLPALTACSIDRVDPSDAGIAQPADGPTVACLEAASTTDLVDCVLAAQPGDRSEGYNAPSVLEALVWAETAQALLAGECSQDALGSGLSGFMRVAPFQDGCVLLEVGDADQDGVVDRGWGMLMVRPGGQPWQVQAPHALSETGTGAQAAQLFDLLDARSLVVSGAHRDANDEGGSCQSGHNASDPAHNDDSVFQLTLPVLPEDDVVVQLHGMAEDSCPGVDVAIGTGLSRSDELARAVADRLQAATDFAVALPEDDACSLMGTTNVQGRALNGVDEPCSTSAAAPSGRFLHVEQVPGARSAGALADALRG